MARNVAIIILYDQDKKILLQHRAEDAERLPGYWAFFGGGIEAGETPERAVKRETLEELNYTLKNPRLIMKQDFLSKDETNEKNFGWFHLSEINKLKIIDHDIEVLKYIKDKY